MKKALAALLWLDVYPQVASKWLFILSLLGAGYVQAQVPNLTYSGPLVITKGGTYTGNYRSTDSKVSTIMIATSEPVILDNCTLVGPWALIDAPNSNANLTVTNCRGYGTAPTYDNKQQGEFLFMFQGKRLVMEHNYLEGTRGCELINWNGTDANSSVQVRYNKAYNLLGRTRNGNNYENACFFLANKIQNVPGFEIGWNEVINIPGVSTPGDNINLYDVRGTPASWASVHDNFIRGSYPIPVTSNEFSGTGMTTDGSGTTAATCARYISFANNQIVSTCNSALNIAAGRDVRVTGNRIVTCGVTEDGQKMTKRYSGINPSNNYNVSQEAFGHIEVDHNVVGYNSGTGADRPFKGRLDMTDGDAGFNAANAINYHDNEALPNPITISTEQNEMLLWQQKLKQNNVILGPSAGTTVVQPTVPVVIQPAPVVTPAATPMTATGATFYRAFNIGGGGVVIDGNNWEAGSNLQVSGGTTFASQNVSLNPATDDAHANMIRASTFGNHIKLTVANVPNASYFVYLYVWEDNNAETFNVSVNGQTVRSNYNSGAAGHWDRLGPFATTVTGGTITVNTDNGFANCSGLEIWRNNSVPGLSATSIPAASTSADFYRAINLNGNAATIDGNNWEGRSAPNYSVNGISYGDQNQQLSPATDASRAAMIRSCQFSNSLDFKLNSVPSGTYQVYAYVWEDNYSETFSIALNGQTMQSKLTTGPAGSWAKLGPYLTTVTNGTIQLTTSGGTVNLAGVEAWRQVTASEGVITSTSTSSAKASTTNPVTLYPNPIVGGQSQVQVEATVPQAQQISVQVLTRFGIVVLQFKLSFPAGTSSQTLNVGSLPQGDYLVRFTDGSLAGTTLNLTKGD